MSAAQLTGADPAAPWPIGAPLRLGGAALVLLLLAGLVWSMTATIGGVVTAPGAIAHASGNALIQHSDGGIVAELLVSEGDQVRAGQVLLRLDPAQTVTEMALAQSELQEVSARIARLRAEADDLAEPVFDPDLTAMADPAVRALLEGQRRMLADDRAAQRRSAARIAARRALALDQAGRLRQQDAELARQQELLQAELASEQTLLDRGLTERARLLSVQLELASLAAERAGLAADLARTEAAAADAGQELAQTAEQRRLQAQSELRDLEHMARGLRDKLDALALRLGRLDLRAPEDGTVQDLAIAGPGAVLRPAEPAMLLVPAGKPLIVVARAAPRDIGHLGIGAEVTIQLPGLDRAGTGPLTGRIGEIAADVSQVSAQHAASYRVEIVIAPEQAGARNLRAGMPALVLIPTGRQTPLAMILSPLGRYLARSF